MMRTVGRRLGATLVAVVALAAGGGPLSAQSKQLEIERFDAEITVAESGRVHVSEAIRFRFTGSWNGVYRDIPVVYETPSGFNLRLALDIRSVTAEDGTALRYEESRERHSKRIKIWVPGANNAIRTVNIQYSSPNALRFIDADESEFEAGHDELYWNVTGDEWEIPIRAASARIVVPPEVAGLRARVYTGGFGSTSANARMREIESGFYFETTSPLGMREGMTVSLAWDPGVIARPTGAQGVSRFFWANWIFLLPVVSFVFMLQLWRTRGRDPARRPIPPQYKPPEGLTPAEMGTLIDNSPDMRDITASMVDLAVRGYIKIEEHERTGLVSMFKGTSYSFRLLKELDEWSELQPHERALMSGLFNGGYLKTVDLDDLENDFYKHLDKIKDGLYSRLLALGFYHRRPDHVSRAYVGGGIALTVFLMLGLRFFSDALSLSLGASLLAAILSAVPVIGFGLVMPARTVKGTRQLEHILGFQEFLDRVEADHFRRMIDSPEMFERYLPHAMALQVEKKWARAFEDMYKEPPDWYSGPAGRHFRPTIFVSDLGSMTGRVGSAMTSQPRSSGGSGFGGGGGFSGGGFGGGGGGGF